MAPAEVASQETVNERPTGEKLGKRSVDRVSGLGSAVSEYSVMRGLAGDGSGLLETKG